MADVADKALFEKILFERHCLHGLIPIDLNQITDLQL